MPRLTSVGLELRVREPAHRMLRTPRRDVHLHVYEPDRAEVRDYLDRARAWRLTRHTGDGGDQHATAGAASP